MNKSNLMSRAHKIAKTLIGNYTARLSMALKMVWAEVKKGVKTMVELKGSEKQVAWAKEIKEELIARIEDSINNFKLDNSTKGFYFIEFKQEIINKHGKPTKKQAIDFIEKMLNVLLENLKNETSAQKLINVKQTLRYSTSPTIKYLVEEFK